MTQVARPFDICGPLPGPGVTLLEASAGTGKTFAIASLLTRLVADGVGLEEILAVTFTRMATGELRDRVRARLVSAEEGLGRLVEAGVEPPPTDSVLVLLAAGTDSEVRDRRQRLAHALAGFDAATITTTHGFCQLVLAGLGVSGAMATGAELIEEPRDLVESVADDLFVGRALSWGIPPFAWKSARQIATATAANPVVALEPQPGDTPAGRQRRLAQRVRCELTRRLRGANLLAYDDLLVSLHETLADPQRGAAACAQLRRRYRVALVDEFQDTDPVQWEVVRRAFGDGGTILVLVGDPKQAVYAFRGADVYAYLDAVRVADQRCTLVENWRSDEGLLEAYDMLLDPLRLGHPDIAYRKVRATDAHRRPGLEGAPVGAPLRARVVSSDKHGIQRNRTGDLQKDAAVDWVAADLAADVVRLLASGPHLVAWSPDGSERSRRPVAPGDVAVLVRTNAQAAVVHRALRGDGVPAVVSGTESVFAAPGAQHWLRLLEALEQPSSRPRAAAVALGPFLGLSASEVALADEAAWESVHARLHRWSDVLRRRGVATLARTITDAEGLPGRMLGDAGGERDLTDLGHVGQLLHAEGVAGQLGAPALRAWLARRVEDAAAGREAGRSELISRQLDSDADAVQVLTVHRAKGLEFPVVYCPYLWEAGQGPRQGEPVVFHDPEAHGRRTLDVGSAGDPPSYRRHREWARDEQRGEDLRLLYTALTRARHQAVIWWARGYGCQHSPLGRLLLRRDAEGNVPASGERPPRDSEVRAALEGLAARAPGRISVEPCTGPGARRWTGEPPAPGQLGAARYERVLDGRWRRTSYTGITAAAHDEVVGSEPDEPGITDEPAAPRPPVPSKPAGTGDGQAGEEDRLRAVPCLLAGMEGGTEVGTFVHHVLEEVDFSAEDLRGALLAAIARRPSRPAIGLADEGVLAAGLSAALATPLGPMAEGRCLRDFSRADRLDELGFELPLAGGDHPVGEVMTADIGRLLGAHPGPGAVLAGYPDRLRGPALATHLRGYLSGSLDLVVRLREGGGRTRFLVVDYKTNRLDTDGKPLSAWHYRPAALDAAMQEAHYPLQALLYTVALHRYLRWRVAGYRPEDHLGGVLYLFLRGMVGPGTPEMSGLPCGVFAWPTPPALVTELSDLLDAWAGP